MIMNVNEAQANQVGQQRQEDSLQNLQKEAENKKFTDAIATAKQLIQGS
jgi:hypothetical protein